MTKRLPGRRLVEQHASQQHPGVRHQHPARLEHQRGLEAAQWAGDRAGVGRERRRALGGVRDAQPAAHVEVGESEAFSAQHPVEVGDLAHRLHQRPRVGQLRADVAVETHRRHTTQSPGQAIQGHGRLEGHAELRAPEPGGDVAVRLGIDVGVDAHGEGRANAERAADTVEQPKLGLALDVEHQDARLESCPQLVFALADAREDDLAQVAARGAHPLQLADRDDVEARALTGEQPEYGQRRAGLDRIADQGGGARERTLHDRQVPGEGRG
jgi:hypothetical protein